MRKVLVIVMAALVASGFAGAARADLGEPTHRLVHRHACGDLRAAGHDLGTLDCEAAEQDVANATGLARAIVEETACGQHTAGGQDLGTVDCAAAQRDAENGAALVDAMVTEVACTEVGADLDCEGYWHDAERLERDVARAASRALKDAGL